MTYTDYLNANGLTLRICADEEAVTELTRVEQPGTACPNVVTDLCKHQLAAYFRRELRDFSVPVRPKGTAFQQQVWQALQAIPYGETTFYRQIADRLGKPGAARAVGAAIGRNPIYILIPCHRVIGKDGSLTGYAGGLDMKKLLLDLESQP